jgi:hypothetical protein
VYEEQGTLVRIRSHFSLSLPLSTVNTKPASLSRRPGTRGVAWHGVAWRGACMLNGVYEIGIIHSLIHS